MELSLKIKNKQPILMLKKAEKEMPTATFNSVRRATIFYRDEVVKNLTAGKFNIKTRGGRLRGSIDETYSKKGVTIMATVGSNLIYARIQEFGGKIKVTQRMAGFAWYKFRETGEILWKAIALLKGRQITIPEHFYFRNTLYENQIRIRDIIAGNMFRETFK